MVFVIYRVITRPVGATYTIVEFMDHSVEAIPVSWIITSDDKKTDWPDLPALQVVTESYPQVLVSTTYSSTCQADVSIIKTPFPCQPHPCLYIYSGGGGGASTILSSFEALFLLLWFFHVQKLYV